MKDLLCRAFCESLDIRNVPAGYVVRTPYDNSDGDPLLVYFVREGRKWRIEDDGTQVPLLEAYGVDLGGRARGDALSALLSEYEAKFDPERRTLSTNSYSESDIGNVALRFVALLLRIQDLALLSPQIVRSTFRDDALVALHDNFDKFANVEESVALSPELLGQEADMIVRAPNAPPMAIYLATSEEKALQALISKMEAEKYRGIDGKVVLMVERAKVNPVKETTLSLAMARLDSVVSFREAKQDTMQRLSRLVGLTETSSLLQ
jgi:Domain of unknown function DUF1828